MDTRLELLRDLCDDPEDFEFEGGVASFSRHGKEYLVELKIVPGVGTCVVQSNGQNSTNPPIPIDIFVQRHLLELPRLAKQLQRAYDAARAHRPNVVVDGPAHLLRGNQSSHWNNARQELATFLAEPELGATRLIQLMAPAGQGKTVLLEELASRSAQTYQPDPYPNPLILVVDLLGRYVGNIDDAIAGSLNNTYLFPSLTQKDVVYCVRRQWLILALDGFDELVARIGARDAFLRISDIVDQLGGAGTVVLSARESFFELYQVTASIRTYLQPKLGTYATAVITLDPWVEIQGQEVFRGLGSTNANKDLKDLLAAFDDDRPLVLQPFFLTRLAGLWLQGERFSGAKTQHSPFARTKFVIETFIRREAEKWTDREGNVILSEAQHVHVLATLAEEMWRSGAFQLTLDEVRIATEFSMENLGLKADRAELVLQRIPTHGALTVKDKRYSFVHDRFFSFFLAERLAGFMMAWDGSTLTTLLESKELAPSVIAWSVWRALEAKIDVERSVDLLQTLKTEQGNPNLATNVSAVCVALLAGYQAKREIVLSKLTFVGSIFADHSFSGVTFLECEFWYADFSGTQFDSCRFQNCKFSDIRINHLTSFAKSHVDAYSSFASVEVKNERGYFAPKEIKERLKLAGAIFVDKKPGDIDEGRAPRVSSEASYLVERYVRASERTTDVAIEDMKEQFGDAARLVARAGISSKVMRSVEKQTSGSKKTFVRFQVDRDRLMASQLSATGDATIDAFWNELAKRFPYKEERGEG